jgi:hypothetical protein
MASLDPRLGLAHDPIHKEIQRVPHLHVPRLDVRPVDLRLNVALDAAPVALHGLYGAVQVVVVVRCRVQQNGLEVDGRARHLQAGARIQSRNDRTELKEPLYVMRLILSRRPIHLNQYFLYMCRFLKGR